MALLAPSQERLDPSRASGDLWRALRGRLPLAGVAVLLCYRFSWAGLRFLTSQAALQSAAAFRIPARRLAFDTLQVGAFTAKFTVSCTFVDVFCVGLVLSWSRTRGLAGNAGRAAVFAVGLFGLNQARLVASYLLVGAGAPWRATDLTVGGVAYFVAWLWLRREMRQFR
jgi:hypothetical protein